MLPCVVPSWMVHFRVQAKTREWAASVLVMDERAMRGTAIGSGEVRLTLDGCKCGWVLMDRLYETPVRVLDQCCISGYQLIDTR